LTADEVHGLTALFNSALLDKYFRIMICDFSLTLLTRLGTLLDDLHRDKFAHFDPQEMVDRVSRQLGVVMTINGSTGAL